LTDNGSPAVDGGSDTDGDCEGDTTIYDLRQGDVAVEEVVTLCGVVVTSPTLVDEEAGDGTIVVQEPDGGPWSAIVLYMYADTLLAVPLVPGDVISVTGQFQEFYGLSEIAVASEGDLEVTGSAALPAPAIVTPANVATGGADAEAYESVVISVEGVTVTNEDMGYGQWQVNDTLLVGDTYFFSSGADNVSVATGDTFEAIHGILEYSYEEFKLSPRNLDDYVGFSGGDADTDADSDADVSIYDIQGGDVTPDTGVTLTDVVVTSPLIYDGSGFFVEEPEAGPLSGIYVHVWDPAGDPVSISVGDIVTITGTYTEFYDLSEVSIDGGSAVTLVGDGVAPAPEVIADPAAIATDGADAEAYEGVLVTVNDVEVTAAVDSYGQILVDDSLMVGSLFLDDFLDPTVGTIYASITGPLTYTYSDSKLLPRTLADLVE
jgi:predicted extracellular nuclease